MLAHMRKGSVLLQAVPEQMDFVHPKIYIRSVQDIKLRMRARRPEQT